LINSLPNITGPITSTHAELNILTGLTAVTADLELLSGAAAAGLTAAELLYLKEVTSDIQAQLNKANQSWTTAVDAGGTVDVITAVYSPVLTLTDGLTVLLRAAGANATTTPTFNPDAIGAKTIKKNGDQALAIGDISGADHVLHLQYNSGTDVWELLNPSPTAIINTKIPFKYFNKIGGFILSNNTTDAANDLDISAGICISEDGSETIIELTSALTKQLDAADFVAGTNQGGKPSALTETSSTWYHVFAIVKDSDASVDVYFDTSITAANIPSGYTAYCLLGSIFNDSGSTIQQFIQTKNLFMWDAITSVGSFSGTGNQSVHVPPGRKVQAVIMGRISLTGTDSAGFAYGLISDPDISETVNATQAHNLVTEGDSVGSVVLGTTGHQMEVLTNASQELKLGATATGGSNSGAVSGKTIGWREIRD